MVKLRQWIGGWKTNATVAKGMRRWQKECNGGKRNVNLVVSSVLSSSEQAGVVSAMKNEICFSLSNCLAFLDGK